MSELWTTATLGEICDRVSGTIQTGPFGSQLHDSDYSLEGIPVVMPKDIIAGRISDVTVARVSAEHVARLRRHILSQGDIIYGRRGDIGRRALVTAREAGWLCGTGCLRIALGGTVIDPSYLFYYLGHPHVTAAIAGKAVGATLPNLNTSILKGVTIRFPGLAAQRRIAGILSAYDDLIAVNTRRIAIVEEMARRLYEDWFIQFRFLGHEGIGLHGTGSRAITHGWREMRLAAVCHINSDTLTPGRAPQTIHYIDISSVSPGEVREIRAVAFAEAPGRARRCVANGDILWSMVRPNRRSHALLLLIDPNTIASTGFAVLRATGVPWSYLYLAVTTDQFVAYLEGRTRGAAYPAVLPSDFEQATLHVPPDRLLDEFHRHVGPLFELAATLRNQSHLLRTARDLLLPKLISGEIDLTRAERGLDAAADQAAAE